MASGLADWCEINLDLYYFHTHSFGTISGHLSPCRAPLPPTSVFRYGAILGGESFVGR